MQWLAGLQKRRPAGHGFGHIGDTATYLERYDDLFNGKDEKIVFARWMCR